MANWSTKYDFPLIYLNKNFASENYSSVNDGSSNQKRAYKTDGVIG